MASNQKIKPTIRERLGGKWAASWTSWVLFIPFALITTLNFDGKREFDHEYEIYLLAVLVHVCTGFAFFIANLTFLKNRKNAPVNIALVVFTFFLAGISRVISADFFSDFFAGDNLPIEQRYVTVPMIILTFITFTLTLDSIDRQFNNLKFLNIELKRMEYIRTEALKRLNNYQSDLLKTIANQILPGINQLENMYSKLISSHKVSSKELMTFSETVKEWNLIVIRAISHLKYESGKNLSSIDPGDNLYSTPLTSSLRLESLTKTWNFYPSAIWLPFLLISFSLGYTYVGLNTAFATMFIHIIVNYIFHFAQKLLRPNLSKFNFRKRLLYISWIYTGYGLIIEAIFLILLPVNRGSTIAIWVFFFPLWSLLGMVVSGLIYGVTGEGGKIQEQTKKQIVESRAAAGSALESIRKIQKIFTETVHGRIQSKFTAASLLLETTAKQHDGQEIPSDLTKQMTNQLEQLLIEARKDLTKLSEWTETTPGTFEEILNSAQKNWTQLVEIDFNIDDLSKQIANENTWLRSAFEDILNETITNAVRHGKANKIKIIAKIDKENKIFNISIVNNGSVQEENSERTGIGFLNLRELGIEIQQFSSDKGHETKIEVPLYFEKNPDLLSV